MSVADPSPPYVELHVATNFSFLRGASHPEELFRAAKAMGYDALGIADHNTVAGIVRAAVAAEAADVRLIPGARLDLTDGSAFLAYPIDRPAWVRLCRLLTLGHRRGDRQTFSLTWEDLAEGGAGLILILLPPAQDSDLPGRLDRLRAVIARYEASDSGYREDIGYLALTRQARPCDLVRLAALQDLADSQGIPTVVTGDVLYHDARRHILQDVVTAIRCGVTLDALGCRRELCRDRHLKGPAEMERLHAGFPAAVARSAAIAGLCRFSLADLRYQYPEESDVAGETPQDTLARLVRAAVPKRYPGGAPSEVLAQLRHELDLIAGLDYAPYFLTVNTIVRHARSLGIVCQGRGSAANSAVCYVLGITAIDPVRSGLLFERFVSAERREPPDIDVDFESDRREEVIQWIYRRYGRGHAALCATVMFFLRQPLAARGIRPCASLRHGRDGQRVSVAGIVLMRQRPATAKGVTFMTVEDETGVANLVVWKDRMEARRSVVVGAAAVVVRGRLQREGEVIHVIAWEFEDLGAKLRSIGGDDVPAQGGLALKAREFR
jgi:error-prone DNA polymerase